MVVALLTVSQLLLLLRAEQRVRGEEIAVEQAFRERPWNEVVADRAAVTAVSAGLIDY